jgi:hypothetical protein
MTDILLFRVDPSVQLRLASGLLRTGYKQGFESSELRTHGIRKGSGGHSIDVRGRLNIRKDGRVDHAEESLTLTRTLPIADPFSTAS